MPELPEVETIRRDLEKTILRKIFLKVEVFDPFVLRTPTEKFIQSLERKSIKTVDRRGKALIFQLTKDRSLKDPLGYLVVQLMMTGQLIVEAKPDKHTRIVFNFTDGSRLLYNDQRRFGQVRFVEQLSQVNHFNILGPEPLEKDFNPEYILERTKLRQRPIKSLLLDHTFVAGIGNIYACEILFRSRIDPRRFASSLSPKETQGIYKKTLEVLQEAIEYRGSSMRNYRDALGEKGEFKKRICVYAREEEKCFSCKSSVKRIMQAGRSTFFCPQCQK